MPTRPSDGPPRVGMVSRRAILSRSRDDLTMDGGDKLETEEEDVWFVKENLYKDHITEVFEKWESIDDEIWAKVIILERNRRIAKAYARTPVLTINGSDGGFDGFRIGVNGFENPMRDPKIDEFKKHIGSGCKLKMDDSGNILIKRLSKSSIFIKNTMEETAVGNDIIKLPNGLLEVEKPFKLFDMKKFQQNVNRELKRQFPERYKLETQCISTIALVKNENEVLDSPIWLMIINIVALEMLKAKMPRLSGPSPVRNVLSSSKTSKKLAHSGSSDEDPYSLTPSGSSGSSGKETARDRSRDDSGAGSGDKDAEYYGPQNWCDKGAQQEVSDDYPEETPVRQKNNSRTRAALMKKAEEKRRQDFPDDPYYCGLSARIPNFSQKKARNGAREMNGRERLKSPTRGGMSQLPGPGSNQFWWHSRLYPDSGLGELSSYHDGGRKQRAYRNQFISPTRPTIFRTGWE